MSAPVQQRRPRIRTLIAAGIALVAGLACRSGTPSGGRYASEVADATEHVEHAVGLKFKRPPRVESRSKAEVRAFLDKEFATSRASHDLAGTGAAYKLLGMLPDSMDLTTEMKSLLAEQIVGFYDPKTKVLYVVDSAPSAELGVVITHELVHALQDQYINLDSIQNAEGDNDRESAADAVIEGQAVFDQIVAMTGNRNFVGLIPGGWDGIRDQIRQNRASMPAIANAPMVLQETLIFPYLSGAEFVHDFDAQEPGKQPFSDMPVSTTQILHPHDAYFAKRDWPLHVTLPPPPHRLAVTYDDNLGEFETRLFLFQHLNDQAAAIRGATGWAGDRYEVVTLPEGPALAWVTVWESAVSAAQFRDLLQQAVAPRYGAHPSRSVTVAAAEVAGHPAVIYEDKPRGETVRLIDPAGIKVATEGPKP
jgi:hypothetical protein